MDNIIIKLTFATVVLISAHYIYNEIKYTTNSKTQLQHSNEIQDSLKQTTKKSHNTSPTECQSIENSRNQLTSTLLENNSIRAEINSHLASLEHVEIRYLVNEYALESAEINDGQQFALFPKSSLKSNSTVLLDYIPFLRLLKSQRYNEIVDLVETGKLAKDATIYQQSLINWIIELERTISAADLTRLLNAGLMVNLDTLYVATQAGMEAERLDILIRYLKESDLSVIWHSGYESKSFATVAAKMKNLSAARFFSQHGSPLVDLNLDLNVATQIPWQHIDTKNIDDFIIFITESLEKPILLYPSQYSLLQGVLDKDKLSDFKAIQLKSDTLEFYNQNIAPPLTKILNNKKTINSIINCHPSLAEKNKYADIKQSGKLYRQVIHKIYHKDLSLDYTNNATYLEIEDALTAKDWQAVLKSLRNLTPDATHTEIFLKSYLKMLTSQVDFSIYEEFIKLYSTIPDYLILSASSFGNNKLATLLINQGANIHVKDNNGLSTLQLAIMSSPPTGNEMIEYLLTLGVKFDEGSSPDAFSLLLSRSHAIEMALVEKYITLFKNHGVVQTKHYHDEIIKNNKLTDEQKEIITSWL